MAPLAIFNIENSALNLAVNLLILFLVVLWLALVFWTWADSRRRVGDPMLVGCATAGSLMFPFVGTIVYMIVRPPEYLDDVRERELEIAAAQARLASIEQLACPHCGFEVEKAFLRCPSCLRRLKEPCNVCRKPLDPRWKICPYCEAEVGAAAPTARRVEGSRRQRPARATAAAAASGGSRPASARQESRPSSDGRSGAARTEPTPRPASKRPSAS
jgi:double zinc ribbon protein